MIGTLFQCNICGASSHFNPEGDWRESQSCTNCGSSVRLRSLIHVLTARLFGNPVALADVPMNKAIAGVGLSDWEVYADLLAERFAYMNTFYHQSPRLDIMNLEPQWVGSADFFISSDVFEHVNQPVSTAFENAFRILKPGGVMVLTAPYGDNAKTIEHYDGAVDLAVTQLGGDFVVLTRDAGGEINVDPSPVFHGGPGTTLEMRVFSLDEMLGLIEAAGFRDVFVHREADPRWGIFPPHQYGLPITARKPT